MKYREISYRINDAEIHFLRLVFRALHILLFALVVTACTKDEEVILNGKKEADIQIYSNGQDEGNKIQEGDSIRIKLRNSCTIYAVSKCDSIIPIYDAADMTVEQIKNNEFICTPKTSGNVDIFLIGYNFEDETAKAVCEVHFNIQGYHEYYYIKDNSYTIESTSEVIKYKIRNELQKAYLPQANSLFSLDYTKLTAGKITYISSSAEIRGTFTCYGTEYEFINGTLKLNLSVTVKNDCYYLIQNLTEEFKLKYPQKEVEKVLITSTASKNSN